MIRVEITALCHTLSPHFRQAKVMGQINKIKMSYLVLGCTSFALNDCLKSVTHRHHQMLGMSLGDALECFAFSLKFSKLKYFQIMHV